MVDERTCVRCAETGDTKALERCKMCFRYFCNDCVFRGYGHRFCSESCSLQYVYGDASDDDDLAEQDLDD